LGHDREKKRVLGDLRIRSSVPLYSTGGYEQEKTGNGEGNPFELLLAVAFQENKSLEKGGAVARGTGGKEPKKEPGVEPQFRQKEGRREGGGKALSSWGSNWRLGRKGELLRGTFRVPAYSVKPVLKGTKGRIGESRG